MISISHWGMFQAGDDSVTYAVASRMFSHYRAEMRRIIDASAYRMIPAQWPPEYHRLNFGKLD